MKSRKLLTLAFLTAFLIPVQSLHAERDIASEPDPLCGPKSLMKICGLSNVETSVSELCSLSGYDETSGTTLYGLYKAARQKGLSPIAVKTELYRLSESGLPAIAFVDGNHFTVILESSGDDVVLQDFPEEPYIQSKIDFLARWNGEVLAFNEFRPQNAESTRTNRRSSHIGPRISLDKRIQVFRNISEGDTLRHSFTFTNTGSETLYIRARSSCSCATANIKKSEIAPGEKGQIDMQFDTHGKTGTIRQNVFLQTNDDEYKLLKLTLGATVKEAVKVIPEKLWLDDVVKGETITKNITLIKPKGKNLVISLKTPDSILATITQNEVETDNFILITLKITPKTIGTYRQTISILTDDREHPQINIPVTGHVMPEIKVFPPKVFFGEVTANTKTAKTVKITSDSLIKRNFLIKSHSPYVSTALTPIDEYNYLLTVNLTSPESTMTIHDSLILYSEGEAEPVIEIPLYVYISKMN